MTQIPLADWWRVARGQGVSMRRWNKQSTPDPLPAHVGLWLDRMLAEPYSHKEEQEWTGRQQLYDAAIRALALKESPEEDPPAVQSYRPLFTAWREEMESGGPGTVRRCTPFAAGSRILLHPASNSSVTDGSILLHHTYGVPYLPGSALKGILRARLDRMAAGQSPEAQRLQDLTGEILGRLGNPSGANDDVDVPGLASLLDFHDALWIPEKPDQPLISTNEWSPLALDIVNPHHPSYYTEKEGKRHAPCDTDEPVPVHRLSYSPHARFLVVTEAPDLPALTPWLDWLLDDVLPAALAEDGIGAWTTAGYGRLAPVHPRRNTAGTTTSEPELTVADDPWLPVQAMLYDAGRGELRALLPDQREPRASRLQTQALLANLPDDLRSALQRNRKRKVEVRIAAEGRQWRLVELRLAEIQQ